MSLEEFIDLLFDDLRWRKKEISDLHAVIQNNDTEALRKSLLLIIYSHWEGFIKNGSKLYLSYIEHQELEIGNLTTNYKAMSLKTIAGKCLGSGRKKMTLGNEIEFMELYKENKTQKFSLDKNVYDDKDKSIIDTEQNLSPQIFFSLCRVIGLPEKKSIKRNNDLIDKHMLKNRNAISHGNKIEFNDSLEFNLSLPSLTMIKNIILAILHNFKDDLSIYAEKEYYLESNSDKKLIYDTESNTSLCDIINPKTKKTKKTKNKYTNFKLHTPQKLYNFWARAPKNK